MKFPRLIAAAVLTAALSVPVPAALGVEPAQDTSDVTGVAADTGAVSAPADLLSVMNAVDGSSIVHVLGYAINGFAERSPEFYNAIIPQFNERGIHFLRSAADACIGDSMATWGFTRTSQLTKTGESFAHLVAREPAAARVLEEQKLGKHPVTGPILVANSLPMTSSLTSRHAPWLASTAAWAAPSSLRRPRPSPSSPVRAWATLAR